MKRRCNIAFVLTLALALAPVAAAAQATTGQGEAYVPMRKAAPNDFGVEILGRTLIYNFSYQRMVHVRVGLEASVSALGGGAALGDEGATLMFGSMGGRFYVLEKDGSPFLTAGGVIVSASTDAGPFGSTDATGSYGYVGAGLEYRSRGGLLFRGSAYGLVAGGGMWIWPGLTVGYAF